MSFNSEYLGESSLYGCSSSFSLIKQASGPSLRQPSVAFIDFNTAYLSSSDKLSDALIFSGLEA